MKTTIMLLLIVMMAVPAVAQNKPIFSAHRDTGWTAVNLGGLVYQRSTILIWNDGGTGDTLWVALANATEPQDSFWFRQSDVQPLRLEVNGITKIWLRSQKSTGIARRVLGF